MQVKSNILVGFIERLRVRLVLLRRHEAYSQEAAIRASGYLKAQARGRAIRAGQDLTPRAQGLEPMLPITARSAGMAVLLCFCCFSGGLASRSIVNGMQKTSASAMCL